MRVLHLTRYFPPRMGGTERFVASLVTALGTVGVESEVAVTDRSADGPGDRPPLAPIVLPVVGPERLPIVVGGRHHLAAAVAAADVVHLHDLRFAFHVVRRMARHAAKPVVLSTHGLIFHTTEHSLIKTTLWRAYYRPALRRLAAVITVSAADDEFCRASGLGANLVRIDNPVDIGPFVATRREPTVGRLLYFGRLSSNKGIERLAPVLSLDASLTLCIAGRGDQEGALRALFAPFGARVEFVNAPSDARLRDELARCACVVLPSRTEAFGMTLVEAMAAGAPVVVSNIPTYAAIAAGTDNPVVDFDDPPAVLAAVRAVGGARLDRGRARATEFAWDRGVNAYVELYTSVMSRPPGGGR